MKAALVESHRERIARIESGEQVLVGVNRYTETEPSPLTAGRRGRDPRRRPGASRPSRSTRSAPGARSATQAAVDAALAELRRVAATDENIMAGDDRRRPRRRDHRRVGAGAARRVRLLPRADRRRRGRRAGADDGELAELRDEVARVQRAARPHA